MFNFSGQNMLMTVVFRCCSYQDPLIRTLWIAIYKKNHQSLCLFGPWPLYTDLRTFLRKIDNWNAIGCTWFYPTFLSSRSLRSFYCYYTEHFQNSTFWTFFLWSLQRQDAANRSWKCGLVRKSLIIAARFLQWDWKPQKWMKKALIWNGSPQEGLLCKQETRNALFPWIPLQIERLHVWFDPAGWGTVSDYTVM